MKEAFVGFDSAWSKKNKGAICHVILQGDNFEKPNLPQLSDFSDAARIIKKLQDECDDVLVAIDQPIIVPHCSVGRPVDTVAKSFMGQLRSAAQSAMRSGKGNQEAMFGDNAPVWIHFISEIGLSEYLGRTDLDHHRAFVDFEAAKSPRGETHLIEVYPALALSALNTVFVDRKSAARYNPRNKKKFSLADWELVCEIVQCCSNECGLQLSEWAKKMASLKSPKKPDQDKMVSTQ